MSPSHGKILGILFQMIIDLPLTVRTIHTSISSVRVYVCLYSWYYPQAVHPPIYVTLACAFLCAYPYPLWDRGFNLSPNIALNVWILISTVSSPPVIVGLIQSSQSCFIKLIQDFTLNISISHSSFGTNWPGLLIVVPFST